MTLIASAEAELLADVAVIPIFFRVSKRLVRPYVLGVRRIRSGTWRRATSSCGNKKRAGSVRFPPKVGPRGPGFLNWLRVGRAVSRRNGLELRRPSSS